MEERLNAIVQKRAILSAEAKRLADGAVAAGRSQYTPDEESQLDRIFGEYCRALQLEREILIGKAPTGC